MYKIIPLLIFSSLLQGCSSFFWELVMTDDEKKLLRQSAKDAAACQVSEYLQAPMFHQDLYAWQEGSCEAVPLRDEKWFGENEKAPVKTVYTDLFCSKPVNYQLTRYHSFCNDYALSQRLGNDHTLSDNQAWTLNPALRFRTPLLKQYGLKQPYMTTRVYKKAAVSQTESFSPLDESLFLKRGDGYCSLQMRIFKSRIDGKALKPLLVFHGGDWHQRSFHAMALESRIPEWTDQGFVVFMPFYRLMGEGETNEECSAASWQEVRSDAEAALAWVQQHHAEFGSGNDRVTLLAQGSGAMLATWLLTQSPDQFHKAALFYPSLDSKVMLELLKQGTHPDGQKRLERLTQVSLAEINDDIESYRQTQLISRLTDQRNQLPPIRLLHGMKDMRIPYLHSVKACEALADKPIEVLENTADYSCGTSQLFLFAEAEYSLDYCFGDIECPAGDRHSRKQVAKVLKDTNRWLKEE